jgi:hypothetical protein
MKSYIKIVWQEWPTFPTVRNSKTKAKRRHKYLTIYGANEEAITNNILYYGYKTGLILVDVVSPEEYAEATGETIPEIELQDAVS